MMSLFIIIPVVAIMIMTVGILYFFILKRRSFTQGDFKHLKKIEDEQVYGDVPKVDENYRRERE